MRRPCAVRFAPSNTRSRGSLRIVGTPSRSKHAAKFPTRSRWELRASQRFRSPAATLSRPTRDNSRAGHRGSFSSWSIFGRDSFVRIDSSPAARNASASMRRPRRREFSVVYGKLVDPRKETRVNGNGAGVREAGEDPASRSRRRQKPLVREERSASRSFFTTRSPIAAIASETSRTRPVVIHREKKWPQERAVDAIAEFQFFGSHPRV